MELARHELDRRAVEHEGVVLDGERARRRLGAGAAAVLDMSWIGAPSSTKVSFSMANERGGGSALASAAAVLESAAHREERAQ